MHDVRTHQLGNGLRVLTIHRPYLHRAVAAVYVHVGSRHERPRHNGLSHFLEHMLFRGSAALPSAALVNDAVESLGASMNAATHSDFTMFELSAPPDALAPAAAIESGATAGDDPLETACRGSLGAAGACRAGWPPGRRLRRRA